MNTAEYKKLAIYALRKELGHAEDNDYRFRLHEERDPAAIDGSKHRAEQIANIKQAIAWLEGIAV